MPQAWHSARMPKNSSRDDSSRKTPGRTARPAAPARTAAPSRPAPSATGRRATAPRRESATDEDSRASFLKKLLSPPDTSARTERPSVAERREAARRAARSRPPGAGK